MLTLALRVFGVVGIAVVAASCGARPEPPKDLEVMSEVRAGCGGSGCRNGHTCTASSQCASGICSHASGAAACPCGDVCAAEEGVITCKIRGVTHVCSNVCRIEQLFCNGVCTDPSVANCGGCGVVCPAGPNQQPTCTNGVCGVSCAPGFGDCNGSTADGCEVNTTSDASNCGACGNDCQVGLGSCQQGGCANGACNAPFDTSRCLAPRNAAGAGACAFAAAGCTTAVDSDDDGLPDSWEDNRAIDLNCDGVFDSNDVPLPGSEKHIKDIYIRIGYMDPSTYTYPFVKDPTSCAQLPALVEPPPGHKPRSESIALVVRAFAGAHLTPEAQPCGAGHVDFTTGGNALVPDAECAAGFSCVDYACLPVCNTDADCAASCNGDCQAAGGAHCVANEGGGGNVCRQWRLHVDPLPARGVPHHDIVSYGPSPDSCTNTAGGIDAAAGVSLGGSGTPSDSADFFSYKSNPANFDPKEKAFKHFVLFAHDNSCYGAGSPGCGDSSCPVNPSTSGVSEIKGNDFVVSLSTFQIFDTGTTVILAEAGTLMHELGHNLGLGHGGPVPNPPDVTRVNHLSVMNRLYQLGGIPYTDTAGSIVPVTARPDYAHSALTLPLDESALLESDGVGAPGLSPPFDKALIRYVAPNTPVCPCPIDPCTGGPLPQCTRYGSVASVGGAIQPIDWNCSGDIETAAISADINGNGLAEVHDPAGTNDWAHLFFSFQCEPSFRN